MKKYVNAPISYSPDDKLLDTELFEEIGKAIQGIKRSKKRSGLKGVQKIFREKKRK